MRPHVEDPAVVVLADLAAKLDRLEHGLRQIGAGRSRSRCGRSGEYGSSETPNKSASATLMHPAGAMSPSTGARRMSVSEAIARRATTLLAAVRDGDPHAVGLYDDLLFETLRETALRRGRFLAADAAARFGASLPSGDLSGVDWDAVAAAAAWTALKRASAAALRFDPAKGDGVSWALGALGAAFLDELRNETGARRALTEVPLSDMETVSPLAGSRTGDPHIVAEARDSLRQALAELDDDERYVVVAALQYGMSHREIAAYRFGDPADERRVSRILERARGRLRRAHEEWREGP